MVPRDRHAQGVRGQIRRSLAGYWQTKFPEGTKRDGY